MKCQDKERIVRGIPLKYFSTSAIDSMQEVNGIWYIWCIAGGLNPCHSYGPYWVVIDRMTVTYRQRGLCSATRKAVMYRPPILWLQYPSLSLHPGMPARRFLAGKYDFFMAFCQAESSYWSADEYVCCFCPGWYMRYLSVSLHQKDISRGICLLTSFCEAEW